MDKIDHIVPYIRNPDRWRYFYWPGQDVKVISNQKYAMDSDSLSPAESCGQIAKDILKRGNRAGCGLCNKLANSFCGGTSVLGLRAEGKEVEMYTTQIKGED